MGEDECLSVFGGYEEYYWRRFKTRDGEWGFDDYTDNFNYFKHIEIDKENKKLEDFYNKCCEKLDKIIYEVILEFSGSGIKVLPDSENYYRRAAQARFEYNIYSQGVINKKINTEIVYLIAFEGTNKATRIVYDICTSELSGVVEMSLEDRSLIEITPNEIEIIQHAILVWIFENVGND